MNVNRFRKKFVRVLFTVMLLSTCFGAFSGITAYAAVDLDITIVPPEDSVTNGSDCEVDLEILTKSDNGYKEMVIIIEYDEDLLRLAAPVNQNGYRVVGSKGQLTLSYMDPTGTNSQTPIGNKEVVPIHFIVLDDAPDTTTKIRANIDHAYNSKGKTIIWTPIYDKTIEIVRINQDTAESDTSSEEESSQFVVGGNDGTLVNRSGPGTVSGNTGRVVSVIIGAIVIFSAGMAAGNIFCMKRYGLGPGSSKKGDDADDDEDEYYEKYDAYDDRDEKQTRSRKGKMPSDSYDDYDGYDGSDDGYYTKPGEDYTVGDDDEYLTAVPVSRSAGDSFPDLFGSASPIGSRSLDPSDFSNLFAGNTKSESRPSSRPTSSSLSDDDEYPALFAPSRRPVPRTAPSAPGFDDEDTIFGKFSANVERNVDDGYGGISSSRSGDRSERSRRNR